ncbi:MAG TPA: 2OG-Fe(II) oxygenase [Polyangiaceae bacterium]
MSAEHRFLEIAAEDRGQPELLSELFAGKRLGAIVRGAFDASAIERFRTALAGPASPVTAARTPHYGGVEYGRALVVSDDLERYFAEAEALRAACQTLEFSFEEQLCRVLAAFGSGFSFESPATRGGRHYALATIRRLEVGGGIDVHCENETLGFPAMSGLRAAIEPTTQLSYYVPLLTPEAGGELRVYRARHGEGVGKSLERLDRKHPDTLGAVEATGFATAETRAGDLLIFDSGRHFHRVTPVEGSRERWTMGGFLALSRERERRIVYYWG